MRNISRAGGDDTDDQEIVTNPLPEDIQPPIGDAGDVWGGG